MSQISLTVNDFILKQLASKSVLVITVLSEPTLNYTYKPHFSALKLKYMLL